MRVKVIFLISVFAIIVPTTYAQEVRRMYFDHLTVKDGLSQSSVFSIYQDRRDFIWIGTRNGLNRFNAYEVASFTPQVNDSTSIAGHVINSIAEDSIGNIWAATDKGLSCYTVESGGFRNFELPDYVKDKEVRAVVMDASRNVLWAGTSWGLLAFDLATSRFRAADEILLAKNRACTYSISSLFMDRENTLWIGTHRHGVFSFKINGKSDSLDVQTFFKGSTARIEAMAEDKRGRLWVGTYGKGVYCVENGDVVFHLTQSGTTEGITNNHVRSLISDHHGDIWIGTFEGLNIFHSATSSVTQIQYREGDLQGLSHGSIRSLLCDRKGSVWIGTYFGGVDIYDPDNQRFSHFYHISGERNSLSYNVVGAFTEDKVGRLVIGTERGGLNVRETDGLTHFSLVHRPSDINSLSGNTVKSLFCDDRGYVWAGIFRGGLNRINLQTKSVDRFPRGQTQFDFLREAIVNDISQHHADYLWIATDGMGGVHKFNLRKEQFESFNYQDTLKTLLGSSSVKSLHFDKLGNLWISTLGQGVIVFNEVQGVVLQLNSEDEDFYDDIHYLTETKDGSIWIATAGKGLYKYNPLTTQLKNYSIANGLANNVVFGIQEDEKGFLWISSMTGLSRMDVASGTIRNYSFSGGFPLLEVNEGAFYKMKNGSVVIGGNNGYVVFNPLEMKDNAYSPRLVFTDFRLSNKKVLPNDATGILGKTFSETLNITLTAFQSVFTIQFAALSYLRPQENQYAYKLEGFDEEWQYVGTKRDVTYTNLPHGDYQFLVKGSNNDDIWNEEPISLAITVLPPPWKTWWAYLLYAIGIAAGFWLIRHNALRSAHLKHDLKLEQLEKEKWKEIHQLKLKYFTDVSHEFRTPLTLIANPLEEMLASKEGSGWFRKQLKVMYYNCRRLLLLIEQILEIRQLETGHAGIRNTPSHLGSIVDEIFDSFKGLADKRMIEISCHCQEIEEVLEIDVDKLEKILYNLISNAFKFTPDGGRISISMKRLEHTEMVWCVFQVSDNGTGIEEKNTDKIFDRFFKEGKNNPGYGIGLSLTKSLVELLGGEIKVQSKINIGTTFTVRLPFKKSNVAPQNSEHKNSFLKGMPLQYHNYLEQDSEDDDFDHDQEKPLILVVEDNRDLRSYLKQNLSGKKYNVIAARNGIKGFEKAKKFGPSLILSDVMMEEMDGLALCEKVKSDIELCHIPVILLTAKGSDIDRMKGLENGADDYIVKPFILKELEIRIANILRNRERLHELYKRNKSYAPKEIAVNSHDEKLMAKIMSVIEENIEHPSLNVEFVGQEVGLSRVHLYRKLKALTGLAPADFIRNIRLQRAAQLLKQHKLKVAEVAYAVGFQDVNYFSKCFRKAYHASPTEFVNQQQPLTNTTDVDNV